MKIEDILSSFRLSEKAVRVYLALLDRGASSVRDVANAAGINRQTTYELLRHLIDRGLVTYYTERSRDAFVAEDPAVLGSIANDEIALLEERRHELSGHIPELRSRSGRSHGSSTVRFYENLKGVKTILEDVLRTEERSDKLYRVYSSATISPVVHDAYPKYTEERIKRGIRVRVFALGGQGKTYGLDERKQLTESIPAPTYTLIYGNKVAIVSLDEHQRPRAVLIEDAAIAETHRLVFDTIWMKNASS